MATMANHDFVTPYDARMETWLHQKGYPHPTVSPGNRFPAKQEIIEAIRNSGSLEVEDADAREFFAVKKESRASSRDYEIRIGCDDWDRLGETTTDSITMHGYFKVELLLLEILSHKCGQLLIYPDTGDPAVIVEPRMDVERVYQFWQDAIRQPDSWQHFFGNIRHCLDTDR
jgi:hypothetical protein